MLPEADSSPDSLHFANLLAQSLGLRTQVEDISGILTAAGCYRRRDEAIRKVIPEYTNGYKCKIVLPDQVNECLRFFGRRPIPARSTHQSQTDSRCIPGSRGGDKFQATPRKMMGITTPTSSTMPSPVLEPPGYDQDFRQEW
jgi:NAD+ synthase